MVAPNSAKPSRETPCPACGHTIKTAATRRNQRAQCPKCRAVIDLAKPEPAWTEGLPPARPDADLRALLARLEALEDRVRALEARPPESPRELSPAPTSPPRDRTLVVASGKLRWVAAVSETGADTGFAPDAEAALLHNLSAFPARAITIGAPAGDPRAHGRAERLREIFERARWAVQGPCEAAPPGAKRGLSLFVGALPASRNASATYFAFTASGFSLHSMIDPTLLPDDALLFVA